MVKHVWAWTHDAHVALQYVEELWKLVDIGLAHKVAKGKLTWVVLGSLRLVSIFVHVHGTELQTVEDFAIQTRSCLLEEDWARTLNLNAESDDWDDRQETQTDDAAHENVERSLDGTVRRTV